MATTGSCSAGDCDRRRGQLLVEQTPEALDRGRSRGGSKPAVQERLALGIDEHIRPPQRVFDEPEPLRCKRRRSPADVDQVGQDLVVGCAVGMAQDRGVATDRPECRARPVQRDGQVGGLTTGDRIARERQSSTLEQFDEQVGPR